MFTHLHVHTEYSLLDGLSRLKPLVTRAKEQGMDNLAITDHGNLHGAIDFYRIARETEVNPIIGCEVYVAPNSRFDRDPSEKKPYHMTMLAKNLRGYMNLVKIVSSAHVEGFYYFPRVDRDLLEQYHEGIIVLSGCPSGEVPRLILQNRMQEAEKTALWYQEVFGNYYLELMSHGGVEGLPEINSGLMDINKTTGIPVVATNDSHYILQEHATLQDILICIHTNTNVRDEKRLRMTENSYYLKNPKEMSLLFPEIPEAITNTMRIAEMCNLEIDFSQLHLPQFDVPDNLDPDDYLKKLCQQGLRQRRKTVTQVEEERLAYELNVIKQTRYANYFLVVWDIARFVRENNISFAVRGSAAGSLVLYSLEVTDVDPLKYDIVFERFLNVERKEMPDIDMDFQDDRREEVLNYVVSKYGQDHVAQIITFGKLGAKASIRDVGRALAMPYQEVDRIARYVPNRLNIKIDEAIKESPELEIAFNSEKDIKELVENARGLEGTTRHSSTHAAGVVISENPLNTLVPLQRPNKNNESNVYMTQYAMEPLASLGLLKMDFLGLSNLTILANAKNLIAQTKNIQIELKDIPLNDAPTLNMLSGGHTAGVFQLEGSGMTGYIKELKPSSMVDVASMIALYRPGPMEHIKTFIDAKHGRAKVQYPDPSLEDILKETYGVIVYQDQVFRIAQAFAGYSLGEADILRKAMGKKIPSIMEQEKEKFIQGASSQGHTLSTANDVFSLIEPFAGYGFPKAHAVSYGLISYWTAYLKANHPEEYMVCLLNAYSDNTDKLTASINECRRLNIPVLPPDIINSEAGFTMQTHHDGQIAIRFGLAIIKNVGESAVEAYVDSRTGNSTPPNSIEELCRTFDMSSLAAKTLESLIKTGSFDRFGDRGAILAIADRIHTLARSEAILKQSNQTSMFDMFGESVPAPLAQIELPNSITPDGEKQDWERELLGVVLSGNKMLELMRANKTSEVIMSREDITANLTGKKIKLTGQIASISERSTKNLKAYLIVTVALLEGNIDIFVWDNVISQTNGIWKTGALLEVFGTVRARDDRVSISCISAKEYNSNPDPTTVVSTNGLPEISSANSDGFNGGTDHQVMLTTNHDSLNNTSPARNELHTSSTASIPGKIIVRIKESAMPDQDRRLLSEISRLLLAHQGSDEVVLEIESKGHVYVMDWSIMKVTISDELRGSLEQIIGTSGHLKIESDS